jgi:hypothetical protein
LEALQSAPKKLLSEKNVCFVLFGRAGSIQRDIAWCLAGLDQIIGHKVLFHFFPADVSEYRPIDLDARRKRLTAFLLHFPPKRWVLDDVLFLVRQIILCQNCANTVTPSALGFQIRNDFWFIHIV